MSSTLAPIIIISVLSIQFLFEMSPEKLSVVLLISLVQVFLGHFENCNFSLHPEAVKPQQEPLSDYFLLSKLMLKPAQAKLKVFSPHTTNILCPFIFQQKACARTHSSYQNAANTECASVALGHSSVGIQRSTIFRGLRKWIPFLDKISDVKKCSSWLLKIPSFTHSLPSSSIHLGRHGVLRQICLTRSCFLLLKIAMFHLGSPCRVALGIAQIKSITVTPVFF